MRDIGVTGVQTCALPIWIEDLRDRDRRGFHIYDANARPPIYTIGTLIASSAGALRAPLDIEVFARRPVWCGWRRLWCRAGAAVRPPTTKCFPAAPHGANG